MSRFTRVLVLAGVVTLTNPLGSVTGNTNDLLAAAKDKAPTKLAVQANSDFAIDLYKQFSAENKGKNLFFSPYSISSALAMTAEGARGQTATEMGNVLRFPDATKRIGDDAQHLPWQTKLIHTGLAALNSKLNCGNDDPAKIEAIRKEIKQLDAQLESVKAKIATAKKTKQWKEYRTLNQTMGALSKKLRAQRVQVDQYKLSVANALWGEKTYPFSKEFVGTINKHYDTGGIFPVDFIGNPDGERTRINDWVESKTENRIQNLLAPGVITPDTRLVLTNAIYFKGDWSVPFREVMTRDRDFTLSNGTKIKTPIMFANKLNVARYGAFNADGSLFATPARVDRRKPNQKLYPDKEGFSIVELPYKGDDLTMVVLAPNDPSGLSAIEKTLSSKSLITWIGQLQKRATHVLLPKFKMETNYAMKGTLEAMGMKMAFSNGADFSGMNASKSKDLFISAVIHKAFVEVNEKGTEAAAATAVAMMTRSAPISVPFVPQFNANRSFIYLIREKSTGSILFLGRITTPSAAKKI